MPENKFNTETHIRNLAKLGSLLRAYLIGTMDDNDSVSIILDPAIKKSINENNYFTLENIRYALNAITEMLSEDKLKEWMSHYKAAYLSQKKPKTIGVVMAGNIPMVGFHDFLCVLITGNKFLGKLSQNDQYLLPALAEILFQIDKRYQDFISFTSGKISDFDAVIATGNNNSARYFEHYFGKYPHIIRKNRNSIAILDGNESRDELIGLANDMFLYFGLGCRNVSKLFVPSGYDFTMLIEASNIFVDYLNHNSFRNNYDYYKTIFQMNNIPIIDSGFFILQENELMQTPVAVYSYSFYSEPESIKNFISENYENIQCIVGNQNEIEGIIPFGQAQRPHLNDYADNVDTVQFLTGLN
jgi:hypothetical protein